MHAQSATIDLAISTIPTNPLPLQKITVSAQSYSADLSQATIIWTYNNQVVANGRGITTISITAPASGVTGTIIATASGGGFDTTSATLTIRPASVDMVWEGADSYTPPFYKGLPLPSTGGAIRVAAIPSIAAPKQVSYSWTQNDNAMQSASGYGKSSFIFKNDGLTNTEHIAVTAKNGAFGGTADVSITPGDPVVAGYFNNDGFIDFANGSTNTLNTTSNGVIVHFEPYYFSSLNSINKDLTFSYTDDTGNTLTPLKQKNELPLSRPDKGGTSQFNTVVSTVIFNLQNITRRFAVNFN